MRPIKLTMSAFGPYAGRQIIEFDKLGSRGLYLVTGDTGAGKTTIFDGISYALFGEASGQNRAANMLRSQYASAETQTYVELEFEYRNEVYKVRRNPEYMRPLKHGTGLTKESAAAEIHLPDGRVYTKIKEVNAEVTEIIGVDRNQFSQIAMIAQGDFQKLLTASTEDRKKIFQKIFNTEVYEKIQRELADRTKKLYGASMDLKKAIDQYASGVVCGEDSVFKDKTDKAIKGELVTSELIVLIEKLLTEDGEEEKALSEEINTLELKMEELGKQIEAGGILIGLANQLANNSELLKEEEPRLDSLLKAKDEATCKKPQIEVLAGEILKLNQELEDHNSIGTLDAGIKKLKDSFSTIEESFNEQEKIRKDAQTKASELAETLKSLSGIDVKLVEIKTRGESLKQRKAKLEEVINQINEVESKKKTLKNVQSEYIENEKKAEALEGEFIALRSAFRNEQAGIMAESLKEGAPCPVCGSTHHPAKAIKGEDAPSEDAVNKAEKKAKDAQALANTNSRTAGEARVSLEAARTQLSENVRQLLGCEPEDIATYVDAKMSECKASIEENSKLEGSVNADIAKKRRIESEIPKEEGIRDKALDNQSKYREKMATIKAQISEKEAQITALKSKLTTKDRLEVENACAEKSKLKEQIEKEIEDATKDYNTCEKNITALKAANETLKKQLEGKTVPDIEILNDKKNELKEKSDIKTASKEMIAGRISRNEVALQGIKVKSDDLIGIENEYIMVKNLSDTASGTLSGKEKIMLEAYVQAFYFDKIIRRANTRLIEMTGGQYELVRKENAGNKRSQAGLDLDVLDHYNGTTRDVRTLSGGESFMASLCLALGLSDEVQQSAGGIKIDTLFVDEGFGSLDGEALNQAMDALISLTEGDRLVGIISHVSELKERIDMQIVVKKTKAEGSVAEIIDRN